jgi:hypothetical protein
MWVCRRIPDFLTPGVVELLRQWFLSAIDLAAVALVA